MSDIRFPGGVAKLLSVAVPPAWLLAAPVHCGIPMEWKAPGPAAMSFYSFAPVDAAPALPPLWRCACGFQRDETPSSCALVPELSR